jgi:hypothetical protein
VKRPALRLVLLVVAGALVAGWWLRKNGPPVPAPAEAAAVRAEAPPPSEAHVDAPVASAAPQSAPAATIPPTPKASGKLSFNRADGSERLELQVAGGAALWDPSSHRLRVLLTDEPLNPAQQQQMLGYLRDERLADSGQPYGVLDLQFRPNATTLDHASLTSASLTVAAAGGLVRDSADVLSSIQWTGQMQPKSGERAGDPLQLELSAAGSARSADAASWQQNWQLLVAVPVVEGSGR